ncbi:hypothetical protein VPH35_032709 [Triticum aestivum]
MRRTGRRRRQRAPSLESADIIGEILLKLPTRDVIRCRRVSRLWRDVIADPTFRRLHAEAEVTGHLPVTSEALLVMETCEDCKPDEASFFCVSSSKFTPMPRRVVIPSGYSISSVCNGLLCFALDSAPEVPAFLCNPLTGETTILPKVSSTWLSDDPTEYKLFRFSTLPSKSYDMMNWIQHMVCTIGTCSGWRQGWYSSSFPLLRTSPPVLIDDKLYLLAYGRRSPTEKLGAILMVDVATEEHHIHPLPVKNNEGYRHYDPQVIAFEMSGRLCLAANVLRPSQKLQFWVMSPPSQVQWLQPQDLWAEFDDSKLCWDLHYSFHIHEQQWGRTPTGAWFDDVEKTLCYRSGDALFMNDTRGRSPEPSLDADCPPCDRRLELPPMPLGLNCKWNVFGGYRPSLLSPLTFASPQSPSCAEAERQQFEHKLSLTLCGHE